MPKGRLLGSNPEPFWLGVKRLSAAKPSGLTPIWDGGRHGGPRVNNDKQNHLAGVERDISADPPPTGGGRPCLCCPSRRWGK